MLGMYASALKALTAEQEVGRLRISPLVITSGGELLTPAVQRRAEEAFGCLVNQTYGASEAIPLALPCRHGRLHLNSDWFVVEPIDAEGRPVPPDARSDGLLVTNLANYVQPVIRYQLGDSVVISDRRCACGTPLPEASAATRCCRPRQMSSPSVSIMIHGRTEPRSGNEFARAWPICCAPTAAAVSRCAWRMNRRR